MPVVDVMNLEGKTVGQVELADDVFGGAGESRTCCTNRCGTIWRASAPERTRRKTRAK